MLKAYLCYDESWLVSPVWTVQVGQVCVMNAQVKQGVYSLDILLRKELEINVTDYTLDYFFLFDCICRWLLQRNTLLSASSCAYILPYSGDTSSNVIGTNTMIGVDTSSVPSVRDTVFVRSAFEYCEASRLRPRSANRHQLIVPRCRLNTYSRRAFSIAGPTVWNSLPDELRGLPKKRNSRNPRNPVTVTKSTV